MAQDDYFYEIQLTNKQLVFYFMAGAAGLILSFLAGVMVGRGIDASATGGPETRQIADEKVVTEQTPTPATDYSYPQRLESERPPEGLERSGSPAPAPAATSSTRPLPPRPTPAATVAPAPSATPPQTATSRPAATPRPPARAVATVALPKPIGSSAAVKGFAVQVGAFKDRASAETVVKSLRSRGLPAFAVAPAGHAGAFFPVRVGVYRDRADAEAVQARLRDDKFQPIVIKQ